MRTSCAGWSAGRGDCAADKLAELAPRADVLVITLPETRDTAGMVDARVLAAFPAGAVVVNVGRGRVVDEDTLVELLQAGRLAGAGLDITAKEPPDPDSLLWELPNVILSPHTAALSPHENERIADLFIDNVRRLDSHESRRPERAQRRRPCPAARMRGCESILTPLVLSWACSRSTSITSARPCCRRLRA